MLTRGQETASRLAFGEFWIGALAHDRPFHRSASSRAAPVPLGVAKPTAWHEPGLAHDIACSSLSTVRAGVAEPTMLQRPPDQRSASVRVVPPASVCAPTARQDVAVGQETAWNAEFDCPACGAAAWCDGRVAAG